MRAGPWGAEGQLQLFRWNQEEDTVCRTCREKDRGQNVGLVGPLLDSTSDTHFQCEFETRDVRSLDVVQLVECPPGMHEVLSLIPNTTHMACWHKSVTQQGYKVFKASLGYMSLSPNSKDTSCLPRLRLENQARYPRESLKEKQKVEIMAG